jgi:hypothetical protein
LRGLLIDPYQKQVHEVSVKNDIHDWYRFLDCQILDVAHLGDYQGLPIDVWVDDEGLLHKPMPPCFRWGSYPNPLAGYGLILSSDQAGESISTNIELRVMGRFLRFEEWERRLDPEKYFDQLSRIYPKIEHGTYGMGGSQNL